MTYREKIQELVKKIESIYADAGWLRDLATEEEKKYWNETRKIFYMADIPLNKLDNTLSKERANEKIC